MNIINSFWGTEVTTYNTYIGGIGGTINTASLLAAKLSCSAGDITNFTVDANNTVKCNINVSYTFLINAFSGNTDITYYLDFDGQATSSTTAPFYNTVNMSVGYFPSWSSSTVQMFRCASSSNKSTFFMLSLPSMTPIGTDATNQQNFTYTNVVDFYCDSANQTNNGGSPDGDLTDGNANFTTINYITLDSVNYPSEISDLSAPNVYGSIVELSWSAPTSTNTIAGYVIFKDGTPIARSTTTSYTVYDLDESTSYTFEVLTYDNKGNFSGFSNALTETTTTYANSYDANIISYWNFNSNSLDQVGSNDGTDTSISYVSTGGIGNSADFTAGTSSNITVADSDSLSFGNGSTDNPFSAVYLVKFNSLSPSTQFLIDKRDSSNANKEYLFYRLSGEFRAFLYDQSSGAVVRRNYATSILVNTWYYILVTYDGNGASGLKMYINNTEGGSDASTGTYTAMENGTGSLMFGKQESGTTNSFNGYLDEIAFFNTELTEAQREDLYKNYLDGNAIT